MSVRAVYLPILDRFRGLLDSVFDLRRYDVSVVVNSWSGQYPGAPGSTKVSTTTPITVAGGARPNVSQLSQKDIIASGGLYQDMDLKVGPLTPPFSGGGTHSDVFNPSGGPNTEVFFLLTGPGLPVAGQSYRKIGQETVSNFHYNIIIRSTAQQGA